MTRTVAAAGSMPGEPDPINAEIVRLGLLRDRLWTVADDLDHLTARWGGESGELFDVSRRALAQRWRDAGDLHHDATRALERYRDARLDLEHRAEEIIRDTAGDPIREPAAAEDILRLRRQLAAVAAETAAVINRCTAALDAFGAVHGAPNDSATWSTTAVAAAGPTPATPQPAPQPAPQVSEPPGAIDLDRTLNGGAVHDIQRDVRVLAAEILVGKHEIVPYGGSTG